MPALVYSEDERLREAPGSHFIDEWHRLIQYHSTLANRAASMPRAALGLILIDEALVIRLERQSRDDTHLSDIGESTPVGLSHAPLRSAAALLFVI